MIIKHATIMAKTTALESFIEKPPSCFTTKIRDESEAAWILQRKRGPQQRKPKRLTRKLPQFLLGCRQTIQIKSKPQATAAFNLAKQQKTVFASYRTDAHKAYQPYSISRFFHLCTTINFSVSISSYKAVIWVIWMEKPWERIRLWAIWKLKDTLFLLWLQIGKQLQFRGSALLWLVWWKLSCFVSCSLGLLQFLFCGFLVHFMVSCIL